MTPTLAARSARRTLWIFVVAGSALLVLALVVGVGAVLQLTNAVHQTQLEGTPTGKKLVASADRILDCTDPAGECTKRNQAATAKAVADLTGNLTRVVVLASACSSNLPRGMTVREREVAIQSCIVARLASEKP